jgi:hypothetical protein
MCARKIAYVSAGEGNLGNYVVTNGAATVELGLKPTVLRSFTQNGFEEKGAGGPQRLRNFLEKFI